MKTKRVVGILMLFVALSFAGVTYAEQATGGSGNSVIEDTIGEVTPALIDIVKAKVTQIGRDVIVFFMELNGEAMLSSSDAPTLYSWFIDRSGTNDGLLQPGDFSVNLLFDGVGFACSVTKATIAGNPITEAIVLPVPCNFEINGNTVRVFINHEDLEAIQASDSTFNAFDFFWWGVTRYLRVGPPNTDRAFDAPPLPGTDRWVYREAPPA